MAAESGQVVFDVTISAIAETSSGSGIFKITALPTAGVESSRPSGTVLNATNGIQIFLTGSTYLAEFAVGRRMVVGIDFKT